MSHFKAKMYQNRPAGVPPQTLPGELTALAQTSYSWNKGDLLLRKGEGCRYGKGRREKGRHGRTGEGKGGKGLPCVSLNCL